MAIIPVEFCVSSPVSVVCADVAPSGLQRRNRVRLPDGREVWSDSLTGPSVSVSEALAACGPYATVYHEEERLSVTPEHPDRPMRRGARRSCNHRKRICERLQEQPNCPRCGVAMVPSVGGRRCTSQRVACVNPEGIVICSGCRGREANRTQKMQLLAERAAKRQQSVPVPVAFSHFNG